MTTAEDILNDALVSAATAFCVARGLRHGIDRIVSAMREAAADAAEDIQDENVVPLRRVETSGEAGER